MGRVLAILSGIQSKQANNRLTGTLSFFLFNNYRLIFHFILNIISMQQSQGELPIPRLPRNKVTGKIKRAPQPVILACKFTCKLCALEHVRPSRRY